MRDKSLPYRSKIVLAVTFCLAMAYFQAASLAYLRELFNPDGLILPLEEIPNAFLRIEAFRQAAVIIAFLCVAMMAGRAFWEQVGWFLTFVGITNIFTYIWLKASVGWPDSLFNWDVLFLLPIPWVGPVIAPLLISLFMIVIGVLITIMHERDYEFRPTAVTWVTVLLGTATLLVTFWSHGVTGVNEIAPRSYPYWLLIFGLALYVIGFWHAWQSSTRR